MEGSSKRITAQIGRNPAANIHHATRLAERIERVFGYLKRNLKLRSLKLRGLAGAAEEFSMVAAAYNLQLLAKQAVPT